MKYKKYKYNPVTVGPHDWFYPHASRRWIFVHEDGSLMVTQMHVPVAQIIAALEHVGYVVKKGGAK